MSDRRSIALKITLDGRLADSETSCIWAGPYVLVIATVLPEPGLAVEVHSTFVGHARVRTCATHLTLGPAGYEPYRPITVREHANLDPTGNARQCAYEHAQIVLEVLNRLDRQARIDVADDAFGELVTR